MRTIHRFPSQMSKIYREKEKRNRKKERTFQSRNENVSTGVTRTMHKSSLKVSLVHFIQMVSVLPHSLFLFPFILHILYFNGWIEC